MSEARAEIFGKIERARVRRHNVKTPNAAWRARFDTPSPRIVPGLANKQGRERIAHFCKYAKKVNCSVDVIRSEAEVPAAVSAYLRERQLPQRVSLGGAGPIEEAHWASAPTLEVEKARTVRDVDRGVSVTGCEAAIAEVGTIVMRSDDSLDQGLALIPDTHIVVVREDQVHAGFDDFWAATRAKYPGGRLPRALNVIAGPSRTADIEARMVLGAHGPVSLHIVLVSADFELE